MSFVGAVVKPIAGTDRSRLFGACFCLLTPRTFVTADHVTQAAIERGAEHMYVTGPGLEAHPVTAMHRHGRFDLAVLQVEHDLALDPFDVGVSPSVGQAVSARAFSSDGWQSLETFVTALCPVEHTSTAVTRGTTDLKHRVGAKRYAYPAVALAEAPGKAFSGAPVIDPHGDAIGVFSLNRGFGSIEHHVMRGLAVRLDAALPWLHTITHDTEEVPA